MWRGRIESDASGLQKIALQIEAAVAALQEGVSSSIRGAAERQTRATEGLLDHIDLQEERLAKTLENISDSLRFQGDQPAVARQHRVDVDHSAASQGSASAGRYDREGLRSRVSVFQPLRGSMS